MTDQEHIIALYAIVQTLAERLDRAESALKYLGEFEPDDPAWVGPQKPRPWWKRLLFDHDPPLFP